MRKLGLAIAAGALLITTQANAGSFPVNTLNGVGSDLVDQVAVRVYVHDGHRYCFYFNGWHGPGWYRCGFAFRRGLGWGGVYGWNSWSYGPYERRFGGRHHGDRIGVGVDSRTRSRTSVETGTRTRTGVETSRSRSTRTGVESRSGSTRTGGEIRSRSTTTGSGVQGGANVRGSTTGSAPKADVPSEGAAKAQGGAAGEGARGGGSMGGGSMGEGAGRRQ
jgi:hypothetical protein